MMMMSSTILLMIFYEWTKIQSDSTYGIEVLRVHLRGNLCGINHASLIIIFWTDMHRHHHGQHHAILFYIFRRRSSL